MLDDVILPVLATPGRPLPLSRAGGRSYDQGVPGAFRCKNFEGVMRILLSRHEDGRSIPVNKISKHCLLP